MRKALICCLFVLTLPALAEAREPHRPPERGTFFIPLERMGFGDQEEAPASYPLAGPAEVALAEIENAEVLARALRALIALDPLRVREAPDMAAAVGAHLPRYRLAAETPLRAAPEGELLTRLEPDSLLILLSVRSGWREVYEPQAHRIGWLPRDSTARQARPAR